jgi:hypothetical protein
LQHHGNSNATATGFALTLVEESGKTDAEWKKVQTINITFCVKGTERPIK